MHFSTWAAIAATASGTLAYYESSGKGYYRRDLIEELEDALYQRDLYEAAFLDELHIRDLDADFTAEDVLMQRDLEELFERSILSSISSLFKKKSKSTSSTSHTSHSSPSSHSKSHDALDKAAKNMGHHNTNQALKKAKSQGRKTLDASEHGYGQSSGAGSKKHEDAFDKAAHKVAHENTNNLMKKLEKEGRRFPNAEELG
ncbi:MAG: hypothetical protein GOMPHAMPRED_001274 [Gomphillus americanus]|uniref:Uncharacterized protein n=1 Tax=Gomphillus americanus TaxID=1940652 RepID=A0A8H3F1C8_9LECA|nr:MAG: hypothetical protein GOMPHAMPRED_001274 [Gomphillus americanus]